MRRLAFLIVLLMNVSTTCFADDLSTAFDQVYQRIEQSEDTDESASPDTVITVVPEPSYPNELSYLARGSIRFYQVFISSQDKPSCMFTPSCSHFGAGCFGHYNPVKALLLTGDRLQRCHAGALGHYPIDPVTRRLFDPVENYDF